MLLGLAVTTTMIQSNITIDYTVKMGESLSAIADKYHTTSKEIAEKSGLKKGKPIKMGMALKIPMNTHIVKSKKDVDIKKIPTKIKIVKQTHTLEEIKRNKLKLAKVSSISKVHTLKKLQLKSSPTTNTLKVATVNKIPKIHTLEAVKLKYTASKDILKVATVNKEINVPKIHTLEAVKSKYISSKRRVKLAQGNISRKLHSLKNQKAKKSTKLKYHIAKNTKKIIRKTRSRVGIVKNKTILTALREYSRPLTKQSHKKIQQRVTVDDILFKSSKPYISLNDSKASKIIDIAKTKLGRKYVWGATGKGETFDCSGFTSYVYKKNGIHIPRTSRNQAKYGKYIARNNLKKGDLIFFDTSRHRKGYVNHVGIYLGNGKFIHASSAKKKVTISNLSKFYAQRYVGARRPS